MLDRSLHPLGSKTEKRAKYVSDQIDGGEGTRPGEKTRGGKCFCRGRRGSGEIKKKGKIVRLMTLKKLKSSREQWGLILEDQLLDLPRLKRSKFGGGGKDFKTGATNRDQVHEGGPKGKRRG